MENVNKNVNKVNSDFLRIKELASTLNLGESATRKLVLQPSFPKIKIGGTYLIPKEKYKEWINQHLYHAVKI